jgi:MoaA/NifB/PqqE/SkfB family radical SAM enzyme
MDYLKQGPQKYLFDGCKMAWYPERLQAFMDGERIMPVTIDMGIHKGCNMRCLFCYGTYQKPSNAYIPTHRLLMLAEDAGAAGVKGIAIIGDGEPTLNKGLYEFVDALTANKVESAVATNGLLLDEDKAEALTRNCTWLRFNISAVGEKYPVIHKGTTIHDAIKIERIIDHAVRKKGKCTIGLQMVLIPECFDQAVPLAQLGVDLGVDYVQIKQFSDAGTGMPMHFDMEKYDEITGILREAEGLSNDRTMVLVKWRALEDSKNITMKREWGFERCIDLPFIFQISGNGKCYPCGYMFNKDEYCYGDVTKERLSSILKSDRYWAVVGKVAGTPLQDLCTGQCRHCCTNKFMYNFTKAYKGDTYDAISELCGSEEHYQKLLDEPPMHLSFI